MNTYITRYNNVIIIEGKKNLKKHEQKIRNIQNIHI